MKTYRGNIEKLEPNQIFVFGSNTEGRHGMGAALWAVKNAGAIKGQATGPQGQSYAIVTKDLTKDTHPSVDEVDIINSITGLYAYASLNLDKEFLIPYKKGDKNLNGYNDLQMVAMFLTVEAMGARMAAKIGVPYLGIPPNIVFEEGFAEMIERGRRITSHLDT